MVQLDGFDAALQSSIENDLDVYLSDAADGVEFEAAGVRILFADITETELLDAGFNDVFAFI